LVRVPTSSATRTPAPDGRALRRCMGAKGEDFYNELAVRYGFEKEAGVIQDLYLAERRRRRGRGARRSSWNSRPLCGPRATSKSAWRPFERLASRTFRCTRFPRATECGRRSSRPSRECSRTPRGGVTATRKRAQASYSRRRYAPPRANSLGVVPIFHDAAVVG